MFLTLAESGYPLSSERAPGDLQASQLHLDPWKDVGENDPGSYCLEDNILEG